MSERLPNGWILTRLDDCTKILDGYREPVSLDKRNKRIAGKREGELFPYFGATGRVGLIDGYLIEGRYVLIGEDGAPFFDSNKNIAYIVNGKIWVNNHAHILDSATNNDYLCHYLNQFNFTGYVTGTTRLKLTQGKLKEIPVKIPPLNEQKRIVAKLDAIMPRIEAVKARLEKVPVILKRFRQSVLTAAVTGKLTEKWREEHPEVESAEVLITSYSFKINNDFKEIYNIPDTWHWCALGNWAALSRGRFSIRPRNDPKYYNGKYPFIQIGDLPKEGGIINSHKQTLNEKGLKVSKEFEKNTIAIAIVGATIGNTGILSYKMCFPDSLIGIETSNEFTSLYAEYYLRTEKENIRQISYSSGGQPNIKLPTLTNYPFPLPPLEEQKEIVRQVDKLFALADKVEAHYQQAKARVDKLAQSVLAKAFRGELVPQDPNDEPAEKLLKRILAEKAKMENEKKKISQRARRTQR